MIYFPHAIYKGKGAREIIKHAQEGIGDNLGYVNRRVATVGRELAQEKPGFMPKGTPDKRTLWAIEQVTAVIEAMKLEALPGPNRTSYSYARLGITPETLSTTIDQMASLSEEEVHF